MSSLNILNKIEAIENDKQLSIAQKIFACEKLQEPFESGALPSDSVYARLLHRLGALQFQLNNMIPTQEAIDFTNRAIEINKSGNKNCSPYFTVNSYTNLAIFYKAVKLYKKAYAYYDSAVVYNNQKNLFNPIADECYIGKVLLSLWSGDYQKCIDDCTTGISAVRKSARIDILTQLFNQRAQSNLFFKRLDNVLADVDSAQKYALELNDNYEMANATKIRALVLEERHQYDKATALFLSALQYRIVTKDYVQIADDYTDLGNFYLKTKEYNKAANSFNRTLEYAGKIDNAERLSKGYNNLGELFFLKNSTPDYKACEKYYLKALDVLGIHLESILENPALQKTSSIGNVDLIFAILNNKTELLLHSFKVNGRKEYLDACINTGLLMDSVITLVRHEQDGEYSKLYWRNRTRRIFVNVLEACYLANNAKLGFYFMEKSRAVLLNDNLNETAASNILPEDESRKEQQLKFKLIEAKTQMINIDIHHSDYNKTQLKYLEVKDELDRYVKTLEQKYPTYYKRKYDEHIPTIDDLRERLIKNNESFVHYFIEDTTIYILVVNAKEVRMIKPGTQQFQLKDLKVFLDFCSDKQNLNNNFQNFAALSHKLYDVLFSKLNIPPGRIIISQDDILIPFEVLSRDDLGKDLLIYSYVFSYIYSASFMLKQDADGSAKANFIGFAPVAFKPELKLPVLKNAAIALRRSASHYSNIKLLENNNATRHSFLSQISDYNIASVFSHAFADTTNNEPLLFMHDSMINLSELQLLNNPATQLVILSACQTNVGRNEKGEGIYSLARGFASVGIPAVAATLWKADENATYQVSDKFNGYIAMGLRKDEALRMAKLDFIKNNGKEQLLPYYWANMILIGKSDPVQLLPGRTLDDVGKWIIVGLLSLVLVLLIKLYFTQKKKLT